MSKDKKPKYVAYFAGACEPRNPGGTASYGVVIYKDNEAVWDCSEIYRPEPGHERETTNNIGEYAALIAALQWFAEQKLFEADITVRGDSKLVIEQMFGSWKIKAGAYIVLADKACGLILRFRN